MPQILNEKLCSPAYTLSKKVGFLDANNLLRCQITSKTKTVLAINGRNNFCGLASILDLVTHHFILEN